MPNIEDQMRKEYSIAKQEMIILRRTLSELAALRHQMELIAVGLKRPRHR